MPTLLLDREKCLGNIGKMARKASSLGLELRPHCKTHQSAVIANWMRDFGISKITVSSFRMAVYFAKAGWEDILVAFPFVPQDLQALEELSAGVRMSILLDHPSTAGFLKRLPRPVDFYVDVDTGYKRTGIRAEDPASVDRLLQATDSCRDLVFRGFYCHAGHSYHARDRAAKDAIHRKAMKDLQRLKEQFSSRDPVALFGDTPDCSIQEEFPGADVLTPGNFVLYDLMQHSLGSCTLEEIAVALACPVAGIYPARGQVLVHGGAIHFSRESLLLEGKNVYGRWVRKEGVKWETIPEQARLTGLSQEHGVVSGHPGWLEERRIGEILHFLPVHSCLTVNLMKEYHTLEGEVIRTMEA